MNEKDAYEIGLNMDIANMSDSDYKKLWDKLAKVEIKLVEKIGECKHKLGETYIYNTPYNKPTNVCPALLHVLDLYTWRAALGFPSWNADDRKVFRIHCPDRTGTVWEMRRLR